MTRRTVFFQDVEMAEGWPEEILAAQKLLTYTSLADGREVPRIRYGDEPGNPPHLADHNCHDCGVIRGQFHVPSCDWERCPVCLGQALGCPCINPDDEDPLE